MFDIIVFHSTVGIPLRIHQDLCRVLIHHQHIGIAGAGQFIGVGNIVDQRGSVQADFAHQRTTAKDQNRQYDRNDLSPKTDLSLHSQKRQQSRDRRQQCHSRNQYSNIFSRQHVQSQHQGNCQDLRNDLQTKGYRQKYRPLLLVIHHFIPFQVISYQEYTIGSAPSQCEDCCKIVKSACHHRHALLFKYCFPARISWQGGLPRS